MSNTPPAAQDNGADARSAIGACPAHQAELFIVPTRYALAEQGADHACCSPAASSQSHPQALRRRRQGYLYGWHHKGPLKRFGVAADGLFQEQGLDDPDTKLASGSLAGIALNKQYDAWLLYSEIPLPSPAHQTLANNASERLARMRQIH